jgi:hypothetical protein
MGCVWWWRRRALQLSVAAPRVALSCGSVVALDEHRVHGAQDVHLTVHGRLWVAVLFVGWHRVTTIWATQLSQDV